MVSVRCGEYSFLVVANIMLYDRYTAQFEGIDLFKFDFAVKKGVMLAYIHGIRFQPMCAVSYVTGHEIKF